MLRKACLLILSKDVFYLCLVKKRAKKMQQNTKYRMRSSNKLIVIL